MSKVARFKKLLYEAVQIARTYGFNITPDIVMGRYTEPHRYWHTPEHLNNLFEGIKDLYDRHKIDDDEFNIIIISAIFHDIVYDPKMNDNEEKSVEFMLSVYKKINNELDKDVYKIKEIILGTKTHDSKDHLSILFNDLDTNILDMPFVYLLDWENKIYKEYEWAGDENYKKGRIEFLRKSIKDHISNSYNIKQLIGYIEKTMS